MDNVLIGIFVITVSAGFISIVALIIIGIKRIQGSMKKAECETCGNHIKGVAEASVQSKETGRIYFPEMDGSTVKLGAGDKLMKTEKISLKKLDDSVNLLCLACGQRLDEERIKIDEEKIKNSPLFDCPDCHKPISKRANVCVHCGCPISEIINEIDTHAHKPSVIQKVETPAQNITTIPKCPTCQSTNVEKISLKSKVGKVVLVGVFAIGKVSKTFKCNACGYQW